jgi:LAGLIDADG endonuclease
VLFNHETVFDAVLLFHKISELHSLYNIKQFFGVGHVNRAGGNMYAYTVGNLDDISEKIIPFFEKYTLQSNKYFDWLLFRYAVQAQKNRSSHNSFANERNSLKTKFYNTSKPNRNLSVEWFLGFCDGEACFTISIVKKIVRPQFIIGLHQKDEDLCFRIKAFLECGCVYQRKSGIIIYQISKREDLLKKLLPLFYIQDKYHRLRTKKRLCVSIFARILKIEKKGPKDKSDFWLNEIRLLKKRMSDSKKRQVEDKVRTFVRT